MAPDGLGSDADRTGVGRTAFQTSDPITVVSRDDTDESRSGPSVPEAPSPSGPDPEQIGPEIPQAPGSDTDPEQLGPEIPQAPELKPGDADSEVVGLFWKLVIVFNVALLGLSVGPMIGFFEGDWDFGLQVFAVGAIAFAYGMVRYYQFMNGRDSEDDEDEAASE